MAQKVSFNIASEASYVYSLSGQKLFKYAKYGPFKCDIFSNFQTLWTTKSGWLWNPSWKTTTSNETKALKMEKEFMCAAKFFA